MIKRFNFRYFGTLINYLTSASGTGIWILGMVFHDAGLVLGIFITIFMTSLYAYCVKILVETSRKICGDLKVPSLTFCEVVEKVFEGSGPLKKWSKSMRIFVDITTFLIFFLGCINYVFVAATIQEIVNSKFNVEWDLRIYIVILIIPVSMIAQIRELKYLVPLSTVAIFLILGTLLITFYYIFRSPLTITNQSLISSPETWPVAITMFLFAISNIRYAFSLEVEMKDPQRFLGYTGILNVSSSIIAIFYAFIGFFSYLKYGDHIQSSVTLNLPMEETAALTAKIFIGLVVFSYFGFIFYICMETLRIRLKEKIVGKARSNLYQILIRFLLAFFMTLLAVLIPDLRIFVSLSGAICGSIFTFFIPILVDTIYSYPDGYGIFKWKLVMNFGIFCLFLVVIFTGTYGNILDIIRIYKN
jgi:proton-coupled amino acid transporter